MARQVIDPFASKVWKLAHGKKLELGPKSLIMGVLNVTPDSFSDGGAFIQPDRALYRAQEMRRQGARIIDVGGESTRPGAEPIDGKTERERVLPIVERLSQDKDIIISIDTYRAKTAQMAVEAGAHIVNDVWGCQREPDKDHGVATAATSVVARMKGAAIFRVHDIEENKDALAVADALIASSFGWTDNE